MPSSSPPIFDADAPLLPERKRKHVEVCLDDEVEYQTRTTGFERVNLPYNALPEVSFSQIALETRFLGKRLAAPLLIGAMTGGAALAQTINHNLAQAAQALGLGMMLGSQRVMLTDETAAVSFKVRHLAPEVLLIGNLGVAQLNKGYGAPEIQRAIEIVGADALALHTNPLQEALQHGDTDFRALRARLPELTQTVPYPLMLKEVGHGLSGQVAYALKDAGLAALDVAGAGGTSWARVEDIVRYGQVKHEALCEWGIPTAQALQEVRSAVPHLPLVASGGIRSGVDIAKALAMGAQVVAVARPLLAPAMVSSEAVKQVLMTLLFELRVAMYGVGAPDVAALAEITLVPERA